MSSILAVQQFCAEFEFPDLSPLISADEQQQQPVLLLLSERYAVIWSVIRKMLVVGKQRAFLRLFCKDSPCLAVKLLFSFVCMEIDEAQCNDAMGIILATDGTAVLLGASLRELCTEHKLNGAIALMDKTGLESIVYSIDSLFKVTGERMANALDHLKYDANPIRFAKANETSMKKREAVFVTKMTSLNATLDRLKAEAGVLMQQMLEEEAGGQRSLAVVTPPNTNSNGSSRMAATKRRRGGGTAGGGH